MLIGGVQVLLGRLLVLLGVLVLPRKLIYGMQLAFNLTKSIERENSKYFKGRLLNPNFKVFRIKQARRLIFGILEEILRVRMMLRSFSKS